MLFLQALPIIQEFDEFKALDDEARREAFEKFIRREKVSVMTTSFRSAASDMFVLLIAGEAKRAGTREGTRGIWG
jgi:hypothetical protein